MVGHTVGKWSILTRLYLDYFKSALVVYFSSALTPKDYNQIFDEPTVALDQEIKERFLQYLLKIKEKIIIVVTHDDEVIACCNHIVEMPGIV